jgi:hypothetical protein
MALSDQERERMRDLLLRAGVKPATVAEIKDDEGLCNSVDAAAERWGDRAPDKRWFKDWFLITGEHMILTEEGWMPADMNGGEEPMEVLDEVNAPVRT